MKFCTAAPLACLALPVCQAQAFYVGGSLALATYGRYASPFAGIQAGIGLARGFELRAAFETPIYASSVNADLLHRWSIGENSSIYSGGGADILFLPLLQVTPAIAQVTPLGSPNYALHGTVGLEYRTGRIGFFGEAQPTFTLSNFRLGSAKLRAGVNYLF